ncbi:putative C6 finger domain protein [Cryphonectria parasitica EP155]|uniref:C6 finger domain protein n=1 Tax=Cryphonectria parasitica (strain ATCC 38755 / EP155) TaxID=660469 RepID=A0A9P4Y1K7_CRYP1|nr:putative C6 finger domain protein [Cryphonectria parasitica EP155]KAF3765324.1 putative C6 finger domain protein [Cryphonectria parasitica EP155]
MISHQIVGPLQTTSVVESARQRHCWECVRRRLVCDFKRPACTRCSASGLDCPGYGGVKPLRLRWLDPGKVNQRSTLLGEYHRYRGLILRSLVQDTNLENKWGGDMLLTGIVSFLIADVSQLFIVFGNATAVVILKYVQQGVPSNWRCHLDAIYTLVVLRGGVVSLARLKNLEQLLRCFVYLSVIGNTTCPASDLNMTIPTMEEVDFILAKSSSNMIPFQLLPPSLLVEIANINRLRAQATTCVGSQTLPQEAVEILDRIRSFSPSQWARLKPASQEYWALAGDVYRSAVLLYGISSLRSVAILHQSPSLDALWATQTQSLQQLLDKALSSACIKDNMLWPLTVLGAGSTGCGPAMRSFVATKLDNMSQSVGSFAPLLAKNVLERFWRSDDTSWDACFPRPYIFATIFSLDLKQIFLQPEIPCIETGTDW